MDGQRRGSPDLVHGRGVPLLEQEARLFHLLAGHRGQVPEPGRLTAVGSTNTRTQLAGLLGSASIYDNNTANKYVDG